jgi:thioredoxin 1
MLSFSFAVRDRLETYAEARMSTKVDTFSDGTWDMDVLQSVKPVLVDFWAEWCQPCKVLAPTIQALAEEYGDRVKVGKLNVDDNGAVAEKYRIRGIPTVLLFRNGEVKEQVVGLTSKDNLSKLIEKHLD